MAATTLALFRSILHRDEYDWEELLWGEIEMIDTAPVGGHLEAAGVSKSRLAAARHTRYDERLTAYARKRSNSDPLYIMNYVVDPWILFDFERLSTLFVEQFVPSCIGYYLKEYLLNHEDKYSDLWGVSFNPALLGFVTRFGFRFTSPISHEVDVDHLILIASDMNDADIEEIFLSALPSVLKGGKPFVVRFSDYNSDSREIWQIDRVIEQCQLIVSIGGISVLDVIPGLRSDETPQSSIYPGALGALHIWAIAKGKLREITGVSLDTISHILEQFLDELMQCNLILKMKGEAQSDWPLKK